MSFRCEICNEAQIHGQGPTRIQTHPNGMTKKACVVCVDPTASKPTLAMPRMCDFCSKYKGALSHEAHPYMIFCHISCVEKYSLRRGGGNTEQKRTS